LNHDFLGWWLKHPFFYQKLVVVWATQGPALSRWFGSCPILAVWNVIQASTFGASLLLGQTICSFRSYILYIYYIYILYIIYIYYIYIIYIIYYIYIIYHIICIYIYCFFSNDDSGLIPGGWCWLFLWFGPLIGLAILRQVQCKKPAESWYQGIPAFIWICINHMALVCEISL
jgi:hypothetical protein